MSTSTLLGWCEMIDHWSEICCHRWPGQWNQGFQHELFMTLANKTTQELLMSHWQIIIIVFFKDNNQIYNNSIIHAEVFGCMELWGKSVKLGNDPKGFPLFKSVNLWQFSIVHRHLLPAMHAGVSAVRRRAAVFLTETNTWTNGLDQDIYK